MKRIDINFRQIHLEKRTIGFAAAGAAVLALLLFFLLFKVDKVEIVGSTKYTDAEIRSFTTDHPLATNTLTASLFRSHIEAEDIPFIESFDLEQLDRHTLRVHVNEKQIIGYVIQGTEKFYFDGDGNVLEKEPMSQEEISAMEQEDVELAELQAEAEKEAEKQKALEAEEALTGTVRKEEETESVQEAPDQQEIETLAPIEADTGNEDATEFHAAVTDVPRILGLEMGTVKVGGRIKLEEQNIFYAILSITRIVEKYKILPEIVFFDEEKQITLVYNEGNIHCQLGPDVLLEEKITRVASILPQLKEQTGILHLEDYTTDTTNIIFSKEALYSLKYKVALAEGKVTASEQEETEETDQPEETTTPSDTSGESGAEGSTAGETGSESGADKSAAGETGSESGADKSMAGETGSESGADKSTAGETGSESGAEGSGTESGERTSGTSAAEDAVFGAPPTE